MDDMLIPLPPWNRYFLRILPPAAATTAVLSSALLRTISRTIPRTIPRIPPVSNLHPSSSGRGLRGRTTSNWSSQSDPGQQNDSYMSWPNLEPLIPPRPTESSQTESRNSVSGPIPILSPNSASPTATGTPVGTAAGAAANGSNGSFGSFETNASDVFDV